MPLKQRCLPVHRRGDEADFQRRPELRVFCPYTLVVDLAGLPSALQVLNPLTCESGFGFVEKDQVSVGQLAVILCVPGPAGPEVIEQTIGASGFQSFSKVEKKNFRARSKFVSRVAT